jgi:hypothetical protein
MKYVLRDIRYADMRYGGITVEGFSLLFGNMMEGRIASKGFRVMF